MYNQKNIELDDFWNDCMNNTYGTNTYKNKLIGHNHIIANNFDSTIKNPEKFKNQRKAKKKNSKNIAINNNEEENNKPKYSSTVNTPSHMRKNITEALKKEALIPIKRHQKQEKINQIFINLYNKDMASKEIIRKNACDKKQMLENIQISKCTFRPKMYKNKKLDKKIRRLFSDSNIYERNIKLKQKHNEKLALLYNEVNQIECDDRKDSCRFRPTIKTKNIRKMLYDETEWKKKMDNDSNKLFLLRYMKAREEEFFKWERLNSPVNINNLSLKKNFSYPRKMVRVLSQKDSLVIKKKLHSTLNSINNLFKEDENEEKIRTNGNNKVEIYNNSANSRLKMDHLQWTFAKKN